MTVGRLLPLRFGGYYSWEMNCLEDHSRVRLWRTNWMVGAEADASQNADADVVERIGESLGETRRTSDSFVRWLSVER